MFILTEDLFLRKSWSPLLIPALEILYYSRSSSYLPNSLFHFSTHPCLRFPLRMMVYTIPSLIVILYLLLLSLWTTSASHALFINYLSRFPKFVSQSSLPGHNISIFLAVNICVCVCVCVFAVMLENTTKAGLNDKDNY